MVTHSSIIAWRIPWTEDPRSYSPWGCERIGHGWAIITFTETSKLQNQKAHQERQTYTKGRKSSTHKWYQNQQLWEEERQMHDIGNAFEINSLLTRGFFAEMNSCGQQFFFWQAKNNSFISQTLCELSHSIVTPHTPIKASNFHETLPSTHSSAEAQDHSPALWVSFSLSVSESITENFYLYVGLIFTLSESELYSEELSSSETLVYMLCGQSKKVS